MAIGHPLPGFRDGRGFSAAHQAVDIPAPAGTVVRAVGTGLVSGAGDDGLTPYNLDLSESGGGKLVTIRHRLTDVGLLGLPQLKAESQYAHLSAIAPGIQQGALVRAGQPIGYVGSTGNSTGNHLHFGFRIGGVWRPYYEFLAGGARSGVMLDADGVQAPLPLTPIVGTERTSDGRPFRVRRRAWGECPAGYQPAFGFGEAAEQCTLVIGPLDGIGVIGDALGNAFDTAGDVARNVGLFLLFAVILVLGLWALVKQTGG